MARLNDAPQPSMESIEALKRRFLRQNREIARVNSTQSLRIRNLESEISRLLAENLALREEIIGLSAESQRTKNFQRSQEEIIGVRSLLEEKLREVGMLVGALGSIATEGEDKPRSNRRKSSGSQHRVEQRNSSRGGMSLGEALAGQEGRLPIIVEDKFYPRKTIDPEDILSLSSLPTSSTDSQAGDSPRLGPPPVAHFDVDTDPTKYDDQYHKTGRSSSREFDDREATSALAPMLETRRRRRDSSLLKDLTANTESDTYNSTNNEATEQSTDQSHPLKSGAKRKLSVRDDDENRDRSRTEEFPFTRRTESEKRIDPSKPPRVMATGRSRQKEMSTASEGGRRPLGPKSTNQDPNSPIKARTGGSGKPLGDPDSASAIVKDIVKQTQWRYDEDEADENQISRRLATKANKKAQSVSLKPKVEELKQEPTQDDATEIFDQANPVGELPPKTPAGLDLFSPPSTAQSTSVQQPTRDTPPPGLEGFSTTGAASLMGTASRPARRQRAAVSYAEPNLRDKMRRPGKELADAVAGEKWAKERNSGTESAASTSLSSGSRSVDVKKEIEDNGLVLNNIPVSNDKHEDTTEAASPLSKKSTATSMVLPEFVELERRRSFLAPSDEQTETLAISNAANAISALTLAGSGKGNRNVDKPAGGKAIPTISRPLTDGATDDDKTVYDLPPSPSRPASQSARAISQMRSSRIATAPSSGRDKKPSSSLSSESLYTTRDKSTQRVSRRHSTNPASNFPTTDTITMKLAPSTTSSAALAARANRRKKTNEDILTDAKVEPALALKTQGSADNVSIGRTGSLRASSRRRSMML